MTEISLNQYRITGSLGAGGMGEVFRARDTRLNRERGVPIQLMLIENWSQEFRARK